uniref:BTB domain-containing protein n=1 Tax=Anopheles farauti TaxID=69004 RepID=A0A182QNN7_9DIPT
MNSQQFSLRWNNYNSYITCAIDSLRYEEDLVDVTLISEGRKIRAHKILLSACSPYFKDVFRENPCQHPVIIFKNVPYMDLKALVEFMYQGEVSVPQEQLPSFLNTAEILAVRGLTDSEFDPRQPVGATASAIAQQVMQTQTMPEKTEPISTANSMYLTLPSGSSIAQQPKLVQTQAQPGHMIAKPVQLEQHTESDPTSGEDTYKIELPEFIDVADSKKIEKYELVPENVVEKIEDDEMGEELLESEGSDMKITLTDEKANTSTASKQHKCPDCKHAFSSLNSMKRHRQSKHHTPQISYPCPLCSSCFKTKWSLSTHKSKYHRDSPAVKGGTDASRAQTMVTRQRAQSASSSDDS